MMAPSTAELERKIETLATGVAELSAQLDTLRDDATDDRTRVGELRADVREMRRVLNRESLTSLSVRLLLGAAMVYAAVSL